MLKTEKPIRLKATFLALALAALPLAAEAAGLGKLTVLSPLGQPLRAELEITASREELSSMTAKIASAESFKQAGVEFLPALTSIHLAVEKKPNGQPYVRLSSDRPVNEPFLDILVELTWLSGRLVREYTFLLDPPEAVKIATPVVSPVSPPVVVSEIKPPPVAPTAPPKTVDTAVPVQPAVPKKQPAVTVAEKAKAGAPSGEDSGSYVVKSGDTLNKIASLNKPDGVSLDQMLAALFRENRDAFDGANMNRLRAGRILSIPDREAATAIDAGEARKLIVAHAADFNAYRKKLAGAVADEVPKDEAPKQAVAGKIAPKVEEKAPAPAPGKDKLEVSRTESGKMQGRIAALEEDLVARDKAVKEANSRVAELEKNLNELKKLAELKSQAAAQAQQQAEAAKQAATPVAAPAKPAPTPLPAEKSADQPAEPPKTVPAVEEKAPAPVADAPKPAARPVVKKAVEPVAEPPGFVEENPELVFGGGGVLALLLGFLGFKAWRRKRAAGEMEPTSRITEGSLTANSVFGSTGGQSVDTSSASASLQTDFSHSGMSAIDADEGVDPVAEADVYMAYGRDAQAEEILLDALKTDPSRHAIHLKLLEIYAGRKSTKQFETLASDLFGQTGGAGADWEKAAAMGRSLDAGNPLYGGKADVQEGESPVASLAATTIVVPPTEAQKMRETVALPGELGHLAAAAAVPPVAETVEVGALDFDLDLGGTSSAAPELPPKVEDEALSLDFDLDLGAAPAPSAVDQAGTIEPVHLDVDLEMAGVAEQPPSVMTPPPPLMSTEIDFDLDLGSEANTPMSGAVPAPAAPVEEASSAMDFDFDLSGSADATGMSAAAGEGDENPEVATKLELAQAYEEMGDKEGARELLQEVLNEGSSAQKDAARAKLAQLAG